jgi:DNA ligase 1
VAGLAVGGGTPALAGVRLQVGRGLLPMLASTANGVDEALSRTGPASVEWKLDGVRVQVHKRGDEVRVFTRNLNDATARSPHVVESVRALPVDQIVLDGEALGVDDAGQPSAFQDSMSSFSRQAPPRGENAPPAASGAGPAPAPMAVRPFFFDVLHLDGDDLLERPLGERQAHLDEVVPSRLVVPRLVTDEVEAAATFLERTVGHGHEGVVVKALTSTYDAGRRGAQWLKVKPVHTIDLVVLAAEWGHGRRTGWLSNLHLGARDPASGGFAMVGKTFKGLTDELLTWQTDRLLALEASRSPGTVHVPPALVVEVAVDGVQRSTRYPGGVALRFARVRRYRPDKAPDQADTLDVVRALLPRR